MVVPEIGVPRSAPQSFALAHSLAGHAGAVLSVAWTHNGAYIISASQDKSLRLWNPKTGTHVKTYQGPHNHEVTDVIIHEDNSKFISCGGDKQFFQWDVTTSQVIRKFVGHERKLNAVAFGPKEDTVLSASSDKTVRIWDLRAKGRGSIQTLSEATDSVLCLKVAGDEIVAAGADGCLRRYDVRKGQMIVDSLLQPIGSLNYSGDRACMLVSTLDSNVRLLECDSGNVLATYTGHVNKRFKVEATFDATDSVVISGSEDNRVCMWNLVDGKLIAELKEHSGPVMCAKLKGESLVTAAGDGSINVWTTVQAPATREESFLAATASANSGLPSNFGGRGNEKKPIRPMAKRSSGITAVMAAARSNENANTNNNAAQTSREATNRDRSRSPGGRCEDKDANEEHQQQQPKRKDRGKKGRKKNNEPTLVQ